MRNHAIVVRALYAGDGGGGLWSVRAGIVLAAVAKESPSFSKRYIVIMTAFSIISVVFIFILVIIFAIPSFVVHRDEDILYLLFFEVPCICCYNEVR